MRAIGLNLSRIDLGDPFDAVLNTGDLNATPDTEDRRLLETLGFVSGTQASNPAAQSPTCQFYRIRLRRLNDILVNPNWRIENYRVIDAKPENTFPSDHFAAIADLMIKDSPIPACHWRRSRSGQSLTVRSSK